MFKIKKKIEKPKPPVLYNVIEDYSEFDAPGNVTACAMTLPEDLPAHAKILAESYDVPLEQMTQLLAEGGVYVYPQVGGLLTRGLFACRIDATGATPKQTWVLDLMQFAEAEQWARSRAVPLIEAATEVFYRTLPQELKDKLAKKNLGLDYRTLDRAVAKGGILSSSTSAKTGRLISNGSASCPMDVWWKQVGWRSLRSCTRLRCRRPRNSWRRAVRWTSPAGKCSPVRS